jgi:hypothetical protein
MICPIYTREFGKVEYYPFWKNFREFLNENAKFNEYEEYLNYRAQLLLELGAKLITSSQFETQLQFETEEHCSIFLMKFS